MIRKNLLYDRSDEKGRGMPKKGPLPDRKAGTDDLKAATGHEAYGGCFLAVIEKTRRTRLT